MELVYDAKPQRVACFNQACRETLFISGLLGPDTYLRGVDRELVEGTDEKGPYLKCPRCGSKHGVLDTAVPGQGIQRRILGLRR